MGAALSKGYKVLVGLLLLMLLTATYLQFSDIGKEQSPPRSVKELWNLGHILYFAVLIFLLQGFKGLQGISVKMRWVMFLVLTFALGLLIEILQMDSHRSSDWMDISRDMVGCLLVLAFSPSMALSPVLLKTAVRVFALLLLLIHLLPLKIALIDEALARAKFPVLADFSTPFELDRWSGSASWKVLKLDTVSAHRVLQVDFGRERYSGIGLDYPQQDWRGFNFVKLSIYQPDPAPLRATVRIHDEAHERGANPYRYNDRFNQRIWLNPGWNLVEVALVDVETAPANRKMDLSLISNLMLFTTRLNTPRTVFVDEIYLSD